MSKSHYRFSIDFSPAKYKNFTVTSKPMDFLYRRIPQLVKET